MNRRHWWLFLLSSDLVLWHLSLSADFLFDFIALHAVIILVVVILLVTSVFHVFTIGFRRSAIAIRLTSLEMGILMAVLLVVVQFNNTLVVCVMIFMVRRSYRAIGKVLVTAVDLIRFRNFGIFLLSSRLPWLSCTANMHVIRIAFWLWLNTFHENIANNFAGLAELLETMATMINAENALKCCVNAIMRNRMGE